MRAVVRLAAIAAIAALVGAGVAVAADQGAKPAADGYRHATMLGGPRSLIGPLKDLAALKRAITRPAVRKNVESAMDAAGLSAAVKDEILKTLVAADASQMKDGKFEVGNTWVWMGLKNAGKADVIRNVRWSGAKPFDTWFFDIDDGETLYHFILPKACGNLALASSERSPKAIEAERARRAAEEERLRAEAAKKAVPPPPPPRLLRRLRRPHRAACRQLR